MSPSPIKALGLLALLAIGAASGVQEQGWAQRPVNSGRSALSART